MTAPRPVRLRLSRAKGFSLQALSLAINGLPAVNCARPGAFGNPFTMDGCRKAGFKGDDYAIAARCVRAFAAWLNSPYWRTNWDGEISERRRAAILNALPDLRGKNLACHCKLCARHAATGKPLDEICHDCAPCHCDPLGRLANGFTCEAVE